MKVGVIGGGVVGNATARCFMEWAEVRVYDIVRERATHSLGDVLACDLVFCCLPTPQKPGGSLECDLGAVEGFFASQRGSPVSFALRSTVPIGTTRRLREQYELPNLVHSPEFLTARCAVTDAQIPARNIMGVAGWNQNAEEWHNSCAWLLKKVYRDRFPSVPVHVMTSDESEAVKIGINAFFSVKVAFFNELRTLADELGLDWSRVMAGILSDGRIAHSHTTVPGPDGHYGFGGTCLPKDIANFIDTMQRHGLRADVAKGAYQRNKSDRQRGQPPKEGAA